MKRAIDPVPMIFGAILLYIGILAVVSVGGYAIGLLALNTSADIWFGGMMILAIIVALYAGIALICMAFKETKGTRP